MSSKIAALATALLLALASPAQAKHKRGHHHRIHHYQPAPRNAALAHPDDRNLCIMLDPRDRDLIIRTVMGEANREPYLGKVGVAAVVKNRLADGNYGKTVQDVLFAPKQFEPWNTRRNELMGYGPGTSGWDDASKAVDEAFAGQDPTEGATNFANVGTVAARGNQSAMQWIRDMSNVSKIGNHTFGNSGAGRGDGSVRTIDTGTDTGGHRDLMKALGFDDDLDAMNDEASGGFDLARAMAAFTEPTSDPRRMAVRSLASEVLDGLLPSAGQGHAVAPDDGAATEGAEGVSG